MIVGVNSLLVHQLVLEHQSTMLDIQLPGSALLPVENMNHKYKNKLKYTVP